MSAIERHYGIVRNGDLMLTDRNTKRWKECLKRHEGKEVEWVLQPVQKHATPSQYAYYRKGIIRTCASTETFGGWEEDDIADYFEKLFLTEKQYKKLGKQTITIERVRQISNLSTKEMGEFIDKVIRWCTFEKISIGSAGEYKL